MLLDMKRRMKRAENPYSLLCVCLFSSLLHVFKYAKYSRQASRRKQGGFVFSANTRFAVEEAPRL